jgi:tripartite ATP-independent transporter DctP family solute receptor
MMRMSRRSVLGGTAATVLIGSRARAQSAEFTYKLAHNQPTTHPLHIQAEEAAKRIKADTGGKVEIQVFPSSQLGSDTDTLSQLRSGAVQLFTLSPLILSTFVPKAAITGIPFAFPDYDAVWKALDGEVGAYVRGQIAAANLFALDKIWDNGFRQITTSNKPIQTAADLKGFKIRVPVSPLWTSMFRALEAAPTSINFNETYSALQTRIVDGQENPMAIIGAAKLYEVQKYVSLTNHMWDGFWLLANKRAWDRLPADARGIVEKHFDDAALVQRADVAKLNATLQAELETKGMLFNKADSASFRDALRKAGFYSEWKGKFGNEAWGLLEKSVGELA